MKLRRQAHCVYPCMYHIVWIPRYRYKVLVNGVDEYLKTNLDEVRKYHPEIEYMERKVQADHIDVVVSFPPKHSIARLVLLMKQNTGRALREKSKFLRDRYWGSSGISSVGYFASAVGLDEETIRRYVRYQEKEDLGQAKLAF